MGLPFFCCDPVEVGCDRIWRIGQLTDAIAGQIESASNDAAEARYSHGSCGRWSATLTTLAPLRLPTHANRPFARQMIIALDRKLVVYSSSHWVEATFVENVEFDR